MPTRIKIATDLRKPNRRIERSTMRTCLKHCPLLDKRTGEDTLVTFRQIRFCPIRAARLQADTALCDYGQRAAHSAAVVSSRRKCKLINTSSTSST